MLHDVKLVLMETDPLSWKSNALKPKYPNLVDFGPLAGESIPQDDSTLVVAAGQKVLVIAAPADTATTNKVWDRFKVQV